MQPSISSPSPPQSSHPTPSLSLPRPSPPPPPRTPYSCSSTTIRVISAIRAIPRHRLRRRLQLSRSLPRRRCEAYAAPTTWTWLLLLLLLWLLLLWTNARAEGACACCRDCAGGLRWRESVTGSGSGKCSGVLASCVSACAADGGLQVSGCCGTAATLRITPRNGIV